MKAEQWRIVNSKVKKNLISRIIDIPEDGSQKVVISAAGSKSVRQRGLQWKWYTEVAEAGIGGKHEDTKEGVHLLSKWQWAVPILIRDDDFFNDLYTAWVHMYNKDEDRIRWFIDSQVHTEKLNVSQTAEFLTCFQRHYGPLVNLTDPDEKGLLG